jgi:MFS family permease
VPRIAVFAVLNLVLLGSLTGPVVVGLPATIARIASEEDRAAALAGVLLAGATAALVANPLFGYASDRTRSRLGRRRPWLLGGALGGLCSCLLVVQADSVPMLVVGWVLAQTSYNAALAALAALLGEQLEERRRAKASGVFAAAAFLGTLPPLAIAAAAPHRLDLVMLAMPAVALVVVSLCCAVIRDPRVTHPRLRASGPRSAASIGVDARPPAVFWWVWLQRLLMHLSFSLVTAFGLYFVMARLAVTTEQGSSIISVTTLLGGAGIVVAALITGAAAGRRGRYGPYIATAAVGLAAAGALRAGVAGDVTQLWLAALVGGLALGVFYAVDLALVLRTVPTGREGAYLGIFNVAETLPQTVAPSVAVLLLGVGAGDPLSASGDNYAALYVCAAAVALLATVPMVGLRGVLSRAAPERRPAPERPRPRVNAR